MYIRQTTTKSRFGFFLLFAMAIDLGECLAIDYPPIKLTNILFSSDAVIEVVLPAELSNPYTVLVKNILVGDIKTTSLSVHESIKWKGSLPLFFTKKALLFLCHDTSNSHWIVLGAAGEGRLSLADGFAYFSGIEIPGARWDDYEIGGQKKHVQRLSQSTLVNAVHDVSQCFTWRRVNKKVQLHAQCDSASLEALKLKSNLHQWLIESATTTQLMPALKCEM